ncbi:hypothetical protein [Desulfogranum marinum]|jgi:hypothetical protein|uniref:hypothetical protein n=1 Tax=Desulfogranum marinum TaxID=453220 RepID=UPI0029C98672|nr:hypothetical protein [Desulfogranum marinum]
MNIFFSSFIKYPCGQECSFWHCPEKYLFTLREIPCLSEINPFPTDSLFTPSLTSPLKSGDLLILHTESREALEKLVEKRKVVEQFRLILIIGEQAYHNSRSYHLLAPRFIMTSQQDVSVLKDVVQKMCGPRHPVCSSQATARSQSPISTF